MHILHWNRSQTLVKNINEDLPYESTGAHTNKTNLENVFEKDEVTGNVYTYLLLFKFYLLLDSESSD